MFSQIVPHFPPFQRCMPPPGSESDGPPMTSSPRSSEPGTCMVPQRPSWAPPRSPLLPLSAISFILFLLMPTELLLNSPNTSEEDGHLWLFSAWMPREIIPPEEEFCCGGGPFSFMAASLISISCSRDKSDWEGV